MTKDNLIVSAKNLKEPPVGVAREFSAKRERLASLGNELISARQDLVRLVGAGNEAMAQDNNRNFARFMESMFSNYQPEVLMETVLWVFRAYRSHGFQTTYWPANLDTWVEMLRKELSEDSFQALYPFYNWLIINVPAFVKITDSSLPMSDGMAPEH